MFRIFASFMTLKVADYQLQYPSLLIVCNLFVCLPYLGVLFRAEFVFERMDEAEHHFDGRAKLKMQDNQQRKSNWIEEERHKLQAYEYLCHIGEAKQWIEACLKTEIGAIEKLAEELRNGIVLARLAQFFHQGRKQMRIFEDLTKLQYRHSDNINIFFAACKAIKTPEIFMFELIDLYEKKNIPKVIYCIHALSHLLYKMKLAPRISDLLGKLEFSGVLHLIQTTS